jgi:hypothetical protein
MNFSDSLGVAGNYNFENDRPGIVNFSCLSEEVVRTNPSVPSTIGHEVCHILLNQNNDGHEMTDTTNLFYVFGIPRTDFIGGTKRFTNSQQDLLRSGNNIAKDLLQKK